MKPSKLICHWNLKMSLAIIAITITPFNTAIASVLFYRLVLILILTYLLIAHAMCKMLKKWHLSHFWHKWYIWAFMWYKAVYGVLRRPVYEGVFSIYTVDWSTEGVFHIHGRLVYGEMIFIKTYKITVLKINQSTKECFLYIW